MARFTKYEKDFITNNYKTMKTKDIAKELNMSYERVKTFADNHHLKKGCRFVFFNTEQEEYIRDNYKIKTPKEIAEYLNCSVRDVNFYADYSKLFTFKNSKYQIDDSYFETINTPNKAYWLGFLYADGCVIANNRNGKISYTLEISLCKEDECHLEKFKMCLKSNAPIKERKIADKYLACRINICNKKICEDLIKLGCTPKKSLKLTFPTEDQVSKELIPHFIRGYLDGDGCVYNGKDGISISFVGTFEFLSKMSEIVNKELGLSKVAIRNSKGKAWDCQWGGLGNAKTWFDYLYNYDDIIFLQRKYEKFFA